MMLDQDDLYGEDSVGIGRGILIGTVMGLVLWALIILCVYVLFF